MQGSGATAVPFSNAANFSLDVSFPTADVSGMGDDWATFIRGMLAFTGTVDGPLDTASKTAWDASVATSERKFYLYPDKTQLTLYYYGTAWVDVSVKGGTTSPVTFSSKLTGTGILEDMP